MRSWPGESRYGSVSLRLSCAVKPPAAQAATPSEPLPSGSDWAGAVFGRPSTTSERPTTPPVSTANAPFRQAVVTVAAPAGGASRSATATDRLAVASRQAARCFTENTSDVLALLSRYVQSPVHGDTN